MGLFGNKTIENYQELIDSGLSSQEVYDMMLDSFILKNKRINKISRIFNLKKETYEVWPVR